MDLRDCLRAVRRRWWLVLAGIVAALGIAAGMTAMAVPQYETSVTFFVTTPSRGVTDSYQGGLFSQQRVKSYADLLAGSKLAAAVGQENGVDLSAAEIQARVTARGIPDTVLLEATVTDERPARSELMANALAKHFVDLVNELETPAGSDSPSVKVEVVAGPLLNDGPVSPRPTRNLILGGILGLLVGVGAAVLRELFDVTIKTSETLRAVTDAPVLAVVPFDASARRSPLVMADDAHSPRAEAFRHLRTNLQFVDVDKPVKVLTVTSSVPEEGKSTTAVNLAIAFAAAGRKVLLIEADLRRPRIGAYLGLEGAVGLSNVLAGQVDVADVLQRWGRDELSVLSSGFVPPNPSELLGSRNMVALLTRLRTEFDVIIIDTPPLLPVTDAAVVAAHADGVVLVVRSGKTPHTRVRTALASLRAVDSRVLGCVLSMQPKKGEAHYYYYRYRNGNSGSSRKRTTVTSKAPAARVGKGISDGSDLRVKAPR